MVQAQNASEDIEKTGAAPDAIQETAQEQQGVADENAGRSDKERAKVHKDADLEAINSVFENDPETDKFTKLTDLPVYTEGALAKSVQDANVTELRDAAYRVVRVLDAAGQAADRNSDLRKVKEALAKGLGTDIEFVV